MHLLTFIILFSVFLLGMIAFFIWKNRSNSDIHPPSFSDTYEEGEVWPEDQ